MSSHSNDMSVHMVVVRHEHHGPDVFIIRKLLKGWRRAY